MWGLGGWVGGWDVPDFMLNGTGHFLQEGTELLLRHRHAGLAGQLVELGLEVLLDLRRGEEVFGHGLFRHLCVFGEVGVGGE